MLHPVLQTIGGHRLLGILVAAGVTAGGYLGYTRVLAPKAPEAPLQTARVERGSLRLAVNASGSVTSPRAVDLSFRQSGVVDEVYVQVGDSITAGQPLAKLDSRSLEFQARQAEIALRTAQLSLDALTASARVEDVQAAHAAVESARAKLQTMEAQGDAGAISAAEASLASARIKLEVLNNPTEPDLASARAGVDTARASLQSAQAKLEQLRNPTPADIKAAEHGLTAAQAKLLALKNPTAGDIAAAQASISSAEANLASARIKLDQLKNPPADQVASAQAGVKNAETGLLKAQSDLDQLRDQLNDEKLKNLFNAYTQLYLARQMLTQDKARNAPDEQIAADEAAVLRGLRAVEGAEADANTFKTGVSVSQIQAAAKGIDNAQAGLEAAQAKLEVLIHPPANDMAAAQNNVLSAEAGLQSARAKLEQLRNPSVSDIAAAESGIARAQADLDKLQNPQPGDLAAAESAVASAQASLSSAQAKLTLLANPSPADIAAANSSIAQADNQLQQTRTPYKESDLTAQGSSVQQALAQLSKTMEPSTAQDIAKAELNVDKAQLDLDLARYNVDQAVLKAPFDGIVAKVNVLPGGQQTGSGASGSGSSGGGGSPISIVDPNGMQVQVNVDETDVAKLQIGQNAEVTVEASGPRPYRGRIVAISPSGTVQSGVTTYQVLLAIENVRQIPGEPAAGQHQVGPGQQRGQGTGPQAGGQQHGGAGQPPSGEASPAAGGQLRAGMTAVGTIVYTERDNVLLVPSRAIKRSGQDRTVEVQRDGKTETRTVGIGLSDDQRTEITSGLEEGETVVLAAAGAGQQGPRTATFRPGGFGGGVPGVGVGGGFPVQH